MSVKKTHLKLILWLFIGLFLLGMALLSVRAVTTLATYFQTGADPAEALNIVPNKPPELQVGLNWQPDDADTGREMEPFTRTLIESAYLRAWLQWNISYLRGEPYGLETYFVGPALEAVTESIAYTHEQGWSMAQTDMMHDLTLHFYHADGSVVSFTADNVQVIRFIRDHTGELVAFDETVATYEVVMMLEDGNWRVRHLLRVDGQRIENRPTLRGFGLAGDEAGALVPGGFVTKEDGQLMLDGDPYYIRGINYYPQATPWHDFWPEYSPEQTALDLALIRSLGLNSVRIFIPFNQFGEHELDPELVANLDDFLLQAEQLDLKVIVTLFDFRTDYQLLLWPNADRHLEEMLSKYRDNPTILAWDIKNEPNLDYGGGQRELVENWLIHIVNKSRDLDPNHLVTIGWSTPEAAQDLVDIVDFVSFHYYAPAAEFPGAIAELKERAGDKPIVLTEFGLPTWNSFFFPNGHSQAEQERYYSDILTHGYDAELAGFQAWTLYDFTSVPGDVAGALPWQIGPQKQLGLVRESGELKPAGRLLAEGANLAVDSPAVWARFLKPFWFTVTVALLLILVVAGRIWSWLRQRELVIDVGNTAPQSLVPIARRARAAGVASSYRDILAGMAGIEPEELLSAEERRELLPKNEEVGRSRSFKALLGHLAGIDDLDEARTDSEAVNEGEGEVERGVTNTYRKLLEQLSGVGLDESDSSDETTSDDEAAGVRDTLRDIVHKLADEAEEQNEELDK